MSEFWIALAIVVITLGLCFSFNYFKQIYDHYKRRKRLKKEGDSV